MPNENETPSIQGSTDTAAAPQTPDINALVNSAITHHLKRFAEKQLPTLLEASLKPLTEKLAAAPAPAAAAPQGEELSGKAKASAELLEMKKQLEEFKAVAEKNEKLRIETEKRAREEKMYSELRGEVAKHAKPEFTEVLTHWLANAKKQVRVGEDGNPYVHLPQKNPFGEVEETPFPLAEGLAQWFRSEEAKPYLPAPQSSQAGSKPMGGGFFPHNGGNIDATKLGDNDSKLAAAAALLAKQNQ